MNRLLMIPALLALLVAAWAGLIRMGWLLPPFQVAAHGPLMISGFFGTVIALERAVALSATFKNGRWAYATPLLSSLGTLAVIAGFPLQTGIVLITLASLGLVLIFVAITRRQPALFTVTMTLGSVCWLVGNILWLTGRPIYEIVYWWMAYLVLTVAGERLELSRLLRHSALSYRLFVIIVMVLLGGLALTLVNLGAGVRLNGLAEIALGLWLLQYDIARRTVKQTGLTRYVALCLLAGYVWLVVGGFIKISLGAWPAGPNYDAVLHSILLGFVFSMIFGHAPIILPSVLKITLPFRPFFYAHLVLLHLSLILRLAGDLGNSLLIRQWGGMFNVIAVLLFLGVTIFAVRSQSSVKPQNQTESVESNIRKEMG